MCHPILDTEFLLKLREKHVKKFGETIQKIFEYLRLNFQVYEIVILSKWSVRTIGQYVNITHVRILWYHLQWG